MTAEIIASVSGIVLSLAFSYIPGLAKWYGPKADDTKRLIMLGILAGVSLAMFGLTCGGLAGDFGITLTCDKAGAITLAKALGAAAVFNQTAFKFTPKSLSRKYSGS